MDAVVTSTAAVSVRLTRPLRVMWPVPLRMSALAVSEPATESIRMLPVPWAVTAVPGLLAVPSLRVMSPRVATRTMLPLRPVVRSDWAASVTVVVVASLLKSVTVTVTFWTVAPLSSVT